MWDVFMDQFEVLATQAPVMLVAGNHERDFPDSGDRYGTNIDSGNTSDTTFCHGAFIQFKPTSACRHKTSVFSCLVKVHMFFWCVWRLDWSCMLDRSLSISVEILRLLNGTDLISSNQAMQSTCYNLRHDEYCSYITFVYVYNRLQLS